MKNYETDSGNILEVINTNGVYEFILHVKKPAGEDIVFLNKLPLRDPSYFIQKYIAEN